MNWYAQIDENNVVIGVHFMSEIHRSDYILISEDSTDVLGKIYNAEDGTFIDPPEPEPEPTPTPSVTMEELNQNQLTIMEALTDLYSTIADMGA